jgi:hypothetical protein
MANPVGFSVVIFEPVPGTMGLLDGLVVLSISVEGSYQLFYFFLEAPISTGGSRPVDEIGHDCPSSCQAIFRTCVWIEARK